jgi:hypothetical protein
VVHLNPDAAPAHGGQVELTSEHGRVTAAFVADPTLRVGVVSM